MQYSKDSIRFLYHYTFFISGTLKGGPCITVEIKVDFFLCFFPQFLCVINFFFFLCIFICSTKLYFPFVLMKQPKCGFLPVSRFIAEKNAVKRTVTRFRMHQALKLHNQEVTFVSSYYQVFFSAKLLPCPHAREECLFQQLSHPYIS